MPKTRRSPAPQPRPRRATLDDLEALWTLEQRCFEPARRATKASLRRSLQSRTLQSVWLIETPRDGPVAYVVLWHHPHTLRIYDIATHPDHRGQGLAGRLMRHAETHAAKDDKKRIILEAAEADQGLQAWYLHQGYRVTATRPDFYAPGVGAVRMEKGLTHPTTIAPSTPT